MSVEEILAALNAYSDGLETIWHTLIYPRLPIDLSATAHVDVGHADRWIDIDGNHYHFDRYAAAWAIEERP